MNTSPLNYIPLQQSIRGKLVAFTVGPVLVLFALLLYVAYGKLEELETQWIQENMLISVESYSTSVSQVMTQVASLARINEGFLDVMPEFSESDIRVMLEKTLLASPTISSARVAFSPHAFDAATYLYAPMVYRRDGQIVFNDIGKPVQSRGSDYTDGTSEWWNTAQSHPEGAWTGAYDDGYQNGARIISYVLPFVHNGQTAGVVSVDVDLNSLNSLVMRQPGHFAFLIDRTGSIVLQTPVEFRTSSIQDFGLMFTPASFADFESTLGMERAAFTRLEVTNVRDSLSEFDARFVPGRDNPTEGEVAASNNQLAFPDEAIWTFVAPIANTEWMYISSVFEDSALLPAHKTWQALASLTGLVASTIAILLWISASLFSRPLTELSDAAMAISRGVYDVDINYSSNDELGRLAQLFRRMANLMRNREQDLSREVVRRTAQLEQAKQAAETAKTELAAQNLLKQSLIDTIPYPLFYKDAEGHYLGANKACDAYFKKEDGFLIGATLSNLEGLPPETVTICRQAMDDAIQRGLPTSKEITLPYGDGTIRDVLYFLAPFYGTDNSPAGVVGTLVDISQQKETARQLWIAKEKAEKARDATSRFLSTMSHEIRTPLNVIIGMTELLQYTQLNEDQAQMMRTVDQTGRSLTRVINDILDLSKIEAGSLTLDRVDFSPVNLAENVTRSLSVKAMNKGISLLTNIDTRIPDQLKGDSHRLGQIISNLVSNAIKYSDSGEIMVRLEYLSHREAENVQIRFSVQDHGVGIPAEAQKTIFEPYKQSYRSPDRRQIGTGLGLAICTQLVNMMGGTLEVVSEPGTGSTFSFSLWLDNAAGPRPEPIEGALAQHNVALISHSAGELEVCRDYLGSLGAKISCLSEERLDDTQTDRVVSSRPDLILLGSCWPRAEQFEIRDRLQQLIDYTPCNFVLLGARAETRIVRLDERTVELHQQPFTQSGLKSATTMAIGRSTPEQQSKSFTMVLDKYPQLTVNQAREAGCLILVVEDNEFNRSTLQRQLNALGYTCVFAQNGNQALNAWRNDPFALILTDRHMPVMDGLQLTREIRREEAGSGKRIPIIATTASALKNERKECLSAGMDDFLAKPIRLADLSRILDDWLPQFHPEKIHGIDQGLDDKVTCAVPPAANKPLMILNTRALEKSFGNDPTVLGEVIQEFINSLASACDEIRQALSSRCTSDAKESAHKLKSAAAAVGAERLSEFCKSLERAAIESRFPGPPNKLIDDLDTLECELINLEQDYATRTACAVAPPLPTPPT